MAFQECPLWGDLSLGKTNIRAAFLYFVFSTAPTTTTITTNTPVLVPSLEYYLSLSVSLSCFGQTLLQWYALPSPLPFTY